MIPKNGVAHLALALAVILGAAVPLAACLCPEEASCCKETAECGPGPVRTAAEPDACGAACCGGEAPASDCDAITGMDEAGGCHCQLFPLEKLAATPPMPGGAAPVTTDSQSPASSIPAPCLFAGFSADSEYRPPGGSTPLHVRVCAWRC